MEYLCRQKIMRTIEFRANQIETSLARHLPQARVTGGRITPSRIYFRAAIPRGGRGGIKSSFLRRDITQRLGSEVKVRRQSGGLEIEAKRSFCERVSLPDLVCALENPPRLTAVMGLDDRARPLLLSLGGSAVIIGEAGQGKTALLWTISLSLAMLNRQREIQIVAVGQVRDRFSGWPHIVSLDKIKNISQFASPHILVVADDLEQLSDSERNAVGRLVASGQKVRVIATTTTRSVNCLGFRFQTKILATAPGQFELFTGHQSVSFQPADITEAETEIVLQQLRRGRKSRQWRIEEACPKKTGWFRWIN